MPSTHAIVTANFGTSVSNRAPVPTANIMLKVNSPTVNLMTLFRSSVVAINRGVSWPLATWITISSDPNVKTMKAVVRVSTVFSASVAPVTVVPNHGIQSSH